MTRGGNLAIDRVRGAFRASSSERWRWHGRGVPRGPCQWLSWPRLIALSLSVAAACVPPVAASPGQAEPKPPPSAAPGAPETLKAAPPEGAPAPSVQSAQPRATMACVAPPDPELDQESAWSKELGGRLEGKLGRLRRCSAALPDEEPALITLRLVYRQDGAPSSQHVVRSTPNACQVAACLMDELGQIQSPKLLIDRASYDLALVLERGRAPVRSSEPPDALAEGPASDEDPSSCADPAVLRLSRANVQDIVRTSHDELIGCYARALARDHDASGKVIFELVIGHEGEVVSAQAREATLYDCTAIECMLEQLRALDFPAPVGRSVRIIYPIVYVKEQESVSLR